MTDSTADGGRSRIDRPPVFSDEPFAAALARAGAAGHWLLVDVTDASKPVSWADAYTTWRDADLVAWLEAYAVAIQIDSRLDAETARILGVDAAVAPLVILFRDGRERLRIRGRQTPAELLGQLVRIDVADDNLALARKMLKDPEHDMVNRDGLADALLGAGLFEEALIHYDWLWQHMAEVDPEMAGVRGSFMARKLGKLCHALPAARARFAELREVAAAAASTDNQSGIHACNDFIVLNQAIDDDERTLSWLDGLDAAQRRALPDALVELRLLPLLYERERWADAGGLLRDPLADLERLAERAKRLAGASQSDLAAHRRRLIAAGEYIDAVAVRWLGRGFHPDVAAIYRSLLAAGREQEAAAVKDGALRIEDSPAMRAALR